MTQNLCSPFCFSAVLSLTNCYRYFIPSRLSILYGLMTNHNNQTLLLFKPNAHL